MEFDYQRLVILIESRNFTIAYVAEKVGVSPQLVYRWVHGESFPGINPYIRLCQLFGVDMNFFYPEMKKSKLEPAMA